MNQRLIEISKFLSLVLRHKPQTIGIALDAEGWVLIDELLTAAGKARRPITREGRVFYLSENKVWFTEAVPCEYIKYPDEKRNG